MLYRFRFDSGRIGGAKRWRFRTQVIMDPPLTQTDWGAYTGCMAGASEIGDFEQMLRNAGFENINIAPKESSKSFIREWLPGKRI